MCECSCLSPTTGVCQVAPSGHITPTAPSVPTSDSTVLFLPVFILPLLFLMVQMVIVLSGPTDAITPNGPNCPGGPTAPSSPSAPVLTCLYLPLVSLPLTPHYPLIPPLCLLLLQIPITASVRKY